MRKNKKNLKNQFAKDAIDKYLKLIETENNEFLIDYVKEIKKISQGFNITLSKEEKLKFCKKCLIPWNNKTRKIRIKNKNKEFICLNCNYIKRFILLPK